jgi:hypothetical protein
MNKRRKKIGGGIFSCWRSIGSRKCDLWNSGLPDFSMFNIPKQETKYPMATKYIKWPKNIPNESEIFQIAIEHTTIFNSKAFQNKPNLGFFLCANIPSGNPGGTK